MMCVSHSPCCPRIHSFGVVEQALAGIKREAPAAPVVVDPEFEAKKAKRAERFGNAAPAQP